MAGMAIGHYRDLLDIVYYSEWALKSEKVPDNFRLILVIVREKFVETALLDWLVDQFPFIEIAEYSDSLFICPRECLRMLDWSPSMQYIHSADRDNYNTSLGNKVGTSSSSIVFNLRTSEYKGNDGDPIMYTRSVRPSTYDLLTQQLTLGGKQPILLSGSSVTQIPAHTQVHVASDYETQKSQLQHIIGCDYLLGHYGLTNLAPVAAIG